MLLLAALMSAQQRSHPQQAQTLFAHKIGGRASIRPAVVATKKAVLPVAVIRDVYCKLYMLQLLQCTFTNSVGLFLKAHCAALMGGSNSNIGHLGFIVNEHTPAFSQELSSTTE